MRILTQQTFGGPDVLTLDEVDLPQPGPGEVLVQVAAAGINPVDAVVRAGRYRPRDGVHADTVDLSESGFATPPFTLGWDVAGTVVAVGPEVSHLNSTAREARSQGEGVAAREARSQAPEHHAPLDEGVAARDARSQAPEHHAALGPGDEVLGLLAFPALAATHAEYVVASVNELVRKPAGLSFEAAGALPLAGLTAWQALVGIGAVGPGHRVLVHAGAGGVGHLAVLIAKAKGAYVIATASAGNHDFVRELGADEVIDYRAVDFTTAVAPVDIVLDLVGGAYAERSAQVLEPGGLLIGAIGVFLGITPERAAELGLRFGYVDVRPSAADLTELLELIDVGALKVHVAHAIPLADAAKAHELLDSGHVAGKIVLVP